jgi:hypothetical protein
VPVLACVSKVYVYTAPSVVNAIGDAGGPTARTRAPAVVRQMDSARQNGPRNLIEKAFMENGFVCGKLYL